LCPGRLVGLADREHLGAEITFLFVALDREGTMLLADGR